MSLNVILTERFKKSLDIYRSEYKSAVQDILDGFENKTFDTIFENNYRLSDSGVARLIKLRLKNSSANKGKSGGFRLIYFINKESKELVFLEFYSKIGANKKEDLPDKEYLEMLREYQNNKEIIESISLQSLNNSY